MPSNSEVVRSIYDSFARGDVPKALEMLAPDVRWTEADGFPHGGTYSGPDEVLKNVLTNLGTEWEPFSVIPKDFVAEGEKVVSIGQYSGTYKATGKKFSAPYAHVWTLRNGKVVAFQQFTDTAVVQKALR
jgi:ketosteroid isomerase-like protein